MKKDITIQPNASIKEALKKLDKTAEKTLVVIDKCNKLLGTLTDGDIRRYIIKTGNLKGNINEIFNKNPIFIYKNQTQTEKIKKTFLHNKIEVLPIVNKDHIFCNYLVWSDVFSKQDKIISKREGKVNIPVVIMAGGKGTRLEPFTQVLPKPLIPIGEKTILEYIMDEFISYGIKKFFITVNYKGEMIEAYFKGIEKNYEIEFIWEKNFLGTAGSLKFLEGKIENDFIVSNCDVLIKADFFEIVRFHRENKAHFTSITAIQHYKIPYGVVETRNGGEIEKIKEKPEFTFQINTGLYIINKKLLDLIPRNTYFDMPELVKNAIERKMKVLAYPVNEGDYMDIGQWQDYKKTLRKLEFTQTNDRS